MTKDRLQIVLITYNRAQYLQKTFDQIFSASSPIRDFDITILDNNSTDETSSVVLSAQQLHNNLKYIKNHYNIGGNANIAKAIELARNEYLWILCDDDKYDWAAWDEVEKLINQNAKLITVSNWDVPECHRADIAYLVVQLTFLPSIILNTSVLTDTVLRNVFDSTVFLFPHLAPVIAHINNSGKINIVSRSIVVPGYYGNDISHTRGSSQLELFLRARTMLFFAGFAYICRNLRDQSLARKCLEVQIAGDYAHRTGYAVFYRNLFFHYSSAQYALHFADIEALLPFTKRVLFKIVYFLGRSPIKKLLTYSPIYKLSRKIVDTINNRNTRRQGIVFAKE